MKILNKLEKVFHDIIIRRKSHLQRLKWLVVFLVFSTLCKNLRECNDSCVVENGGFGNMQTAKAQESL